MNDRREFIRGAGAMALAVTLPRVTGGATRRLASRRIPGTDQHLAVVGLGNSQAFRNGDSETSMRLLTSFFERGGHYIDCGGEGANLVASIAGTLGQGDAAFLGSYFSAENAVNSESAMQRLRAIKGGKPLNLVHTYPEDGAPHWDVLRGWKDEGLTRFIGLARHNSRYYDAMMKVMSTGTMDFLQVNLSPLEVEAEDRILPMAMDKGVAVTINRPFINGQYFSIVKGQQLPAWAVEFDCTSWAQFSIKYILSHPAVICVLTETANPKHLLDNLGGGIGRLPDAKTRIRMRELIHSFS
ncbi:MAG: aldo/keto reductase [Woeseiaceae bacterium]